METAQDPRPGRNGNRPPEKHQFKPGQSGNPGGRPKRVSADLVHATMLSNVQALARELVRELVKSARDGNRTEISFIVNRLDNLHLALGPESYEPPTSTRTPSGRSGSSEKGECKGGGE